MGWMWVVAGLVVLVGAGMLIDHRRSRGVPVPPGLTGRARRRAVRQARAELNRYQTRRKTADTNRTRAAAGSVDPTAPHPMAELGER